MGYVWRKRLGTAALEYHKTKIKTKTDSCNWLTNFFPSMTSIFCCCHSNEPHFEVLQLQLSLLLLLLSLSLLFEDGRQSVIVLRHFTVAQVVIFFFLQETSSSQLRQIIFFIKIKFKNYKTEFCAQSSVQELFPQDCHSHENVLHI